MEFSRQNTGAGILSLLKGTFPTEGLNPGLSQSRQLLYQETTREAQENWSGYPSPSSVELPNPGIEPGSTALQVDSLPNKL